MKNSPFHFGELAVQQKAGEQYMAQQVGRGIRDFIPAPAFGFIETQPLAFVTSADAQGNLWVSVLLGKAGFFELSSEKTLLLHLDALQSNRGDIFWQNIKEQPQVGMLFIEMATRRRFRVNGRSSRVGEKLIISVQQSFGNCPKYIQSRDVEVGQKEALIQAHELSGVSLLKEQQEFIQKADTFVVGSGDANSNLDTSHRGGNPGFIHVLDDRTLKIPDYPGNSMYNTLGNFEANPKAGILFVDFEQGKVLQLTGEARILWDAADTIEETGGTKRFWEFHIDAWKESEVLSNLSWTFLEYSRFNPEI